MLIVGAPIRFLILALLATSRRIRGVVSNSHICAALAPSRLGHQQCP